jgi:16S rRNA (cytosine1407-C5)-methyltransferase
MRNVYYNEQLHSYLKKLLQSDYQSYIDTTEIPAAVRVNTLKTTAKSFQQWTKALGQSLMPLPFSSLGFLLPSDPVPLSHTLPFFMGYFQYHGVSSQVPVLLLNPKSGERVLDMTAAPGSKSTQIAACMQNRGELVLNDWSHRRLQALNANLQRSGAVNYYVLNLRAESLGHLFPAYFDKVLLDAPCSALGTLAGKREIHYWWTKERLLKLTRIQLQLLVSALKALKTDGECVYATCSVAPEENECLIDKICRDYPVEPVAVNDHLKNHFSTGLARYEGTTFTCDPIKSLRIWPHLHGYEGFFAVKLRKRGPIGDKGEQQALFNATLTIEDPQIKEIISEISHEWGIPDTYFESFRYKVTKHRIWMVCSDITSYLDHKFVSAGLLLAERKWHGWKLTTGGSQIINRLISKKIITLDEAEMKQLFAQSVISAKGIAPGYYVLKQADDIIATVYSDGMQLKTRLPHAFDLHL